MKVCWLAPYDVRQLSSEYAGLLRRVPHASSWVTVLGDALGRQDGVELHIVTLLPEAVRRADIRENSIFFHLIPSGVPLWRKPYPAKFPVDIGTFYARERWSMAGIVRSIGADVVHGHGTEAAYGLAAAGCGCPCIVSMQGIVSRIHGVRPSPHTLVGGWLERRLLHRLRHVACRTSFDKEFVRSINPRIRIHHVDEAVSPRFTTAKRKPTSAPRFLFVGELCRWKGLETLLRVVALVARDRPDVQLVLAGTGRPAYVKRLLGMCEDLGIGAKVCFAGQCDRESLIRRHEESMVLVHPSLIDNSPNAVTEAMASGLPVVASNVGGIPSLVDDGKTGWLLDQGDEKGWARHLLWLIENHAEREVVAARAREIALVRHDPDRIAACTVEIYKEIIGERK